MFDRTRTPEARAKSRELRIARELKSTHANRPVSPAFRRAVR